MQATMGAPVRVCLSPCVSIKLRTSHQYRLTQSIEHIVVEDPRAPALDAVNARQALQLQSRFQVSPATFNQIENKYVPGASPSALASSDR